MEKTDCDSDLSLDDIEESESSGEENKFLGLVELVGNPRVKNENYLHTVAEYSDQHFLEHFRVSRCIVQSLQDKFKVCIYFSEGSGREGHISPHDQILIFLWFAGHQTSSYRDVADRFDITISSLYRILRRVIYFLSDLAKEEIKWPSESEKKTSSDYFAAKNFPGGVLGCIDGTHVKIDKPKIDPESYVNRKGYYSIQMQAVCNNKLKFIDVFIGYPGSVHDSRVYRTSPLSDELAEKCGAHFILGDSGYPCTSHLLTPYRDFGQLTARQKNFNNILSKNRILIEHAFGLLKQKFRQLYHLKLRKMDDMCHFIRACTVLHNMSLTENEEVHPIESDAEELELNEEMVPEDEGTVRDRVARDLPLLNI